MISRLFKNLIAFFAFVIFVLFLLQKFANVYKGNIFLQKIVDFKLEEKEVLEVEEEVIETTEVEEEKEEVYEKLDQYYNRDNINYERIASARDDENKEKLLELLNRFAVSDLKEIAGQERLNYIKYYDGMKIVGDSNVRHFDFYRVLEKEYYYALPGQNLEYQAEHAAEYVDADTKKIVFWNGYNIAKYKDAKEYVDKYQALFDKIKEINPNVEVYVCSLTPATEEAIKRDLNSDVSHNIHRGREYDEALKEYFGDRYIDIKFMAKNKYYGSDGIHFKAEFYYMLVPYLAYYTELEWEKN